MGFKVRFDGRSKKEQDQSVEAATYKQAVAIGRSWSRDGCFKIYENNQLLEIWIADKKVEL